jgi:hypothetical protein
VTEVIDDLDLTAGTGSPLTHAAPLVDLLTYGHATEVFSSRKLHRGRSAQSNFAAAQS